MKIGFGAIGIKKGVPGSLDYIDPSSFKHDDICLVVDNNKMYFYTMQEYSGVNESIPFVIKPLNVEDGQILTRLKRWHLISQKNFTSNIIQTLQNQIQTRRFIAQQTSIISIFLVDYDNKILTDYDEIYASDYDEIYGSGSTMEIEAANGMNITINDDGSVTFPLLMSCSNPVEDEHAVTKEYLMVELTILDETIRDYLDLVVEDFDDIVRPNIIQYVDDKVIELQNIIEMGYDIESDLLQLQLQSNIELYLSNEIDDWNYDVIDNNVEWLEEQPVPNYNSFVFMINEWGVDGDLYYVEILHEWDIDRFMVEFYVDGMVMNPTKVEYDNNTIKIWMNQEIILNVSIFYIGQ